MEDGVRGRMGPGEDSVRGRMVLRGRMDGDRGEDGARRRMVTGGE